MFLSPPEMKTKNNYVPGKGSFKYICSLLHIQPKAMFGFMFVKELPARHFLEIFLMFANS